MHTANFMVFIMNGYVIILFINIVVYSSKYDF
jgi:hypothetical protein